MKRAVEVKTETKTITVHKYGVWLTIKELESITNALYKVDTNNKLLGQLNIILRDSMDHLRAKMDNGHKLTVTEEEVLNNAENCPENNCD